MPPALLTKTRSDARMNTHTRVPGKGSFSFAVAPEGDRRDALRWLDHAYRAAEE